MAWIRLDDKFPNHPKVVKAGPEAAWLYITGLCYCNQYLTDGMIPGDVVARLIEGDIAKALALAKRLVEVCLWLAIENGDFEVHDYLDYQESKANILALKEARAQSGRLGGLAKGLAKRKQNDSKSVAEEEVRRRSKKKKERLREGEASPFHTPPISLKGNAITPDFIEVMVKEFGPQLGGDGEVRNIIEEALNHKAMDKRKDKRLYLRGWLRRDAKERSSGRSEGTTSRLSSPGQGASKGDPGREGGTDGGVPAEADPFAKYG